MVYILTSIWVLHTQNMVKMCIFNLLNGKKLKKARHLQQNSAKKQVFYVSTKTLVERFISQINGIYSLSFTKREYITEREQELKYTATTFPKNILAR